MKTHCYVNGEIRRTDDATVSVTDLGLQRGYGVFDFGRTCRGKLFHFEENLARLRRSAAELHLEVPISDEEIFEIAEVLIGKSELKIPSVRLLLTGGPTESSPPFRNPSFVIIEEELLQYSDELYQDGVSIISVEYQRELAHVKSINYLNSIRLEPMRKEKGAFDILYHSQSGISECPRSNFFAFLGDTLVTAGDHVLHGVTRKLVLEQAREHFPVEERRIDLSEIAAFDEAFVTSTTKRVLPVTRIDERAIGSGGVGERTKALMQIFDTYVDSYE